MLPLQIVCQFGNSLSAAANMSLDLSHCEGRSPLAESCPPFKSSCDISAIAAKPKAFAHKDLIESDLDWMDTRAREGYVIGDMRCTVT